MPLDSQYQPVLLNAELHQTPEDVNFIEMGTNGPVISCYNMQINHSFLMSLSTYQENSRQKMKECDPRQSASAAFLVLLIPCQSVNTKNSADLHL